MFGTPKPAFGANTSSFGGFGTPDVSTPFGQSSTFGKPAGSTFGAGGAFGAAAGSTAGGGLFGAAPGVSATQPASMFTSTQPATAFGQANTGGMFGAQPSGSTLFGQTAPAAQPFGAKPTGFGMAAPSGGGMFGNPGTGMFGSPQPTTGLFGATTGFGNTAGQTGSYIKFTPVTGNDVMVKNGHQQNINTQHQCITCMKEYEGKSLEELRMEDYAIGRRGGGAAGAAVAGGGGVFGAQPAQTGAFGQAQPATGLFNQDKPNTMFGQANTGFMPKTGQPSTGLFGSFGSTPAAPSAFSFGQGAVGAGGFGAKPFGQPGGLFGAAATQSQPSAFTPAQQNTVFSGRPLQQNQPTSLFGAKPAGTPAFGMPQPAANTGFGGFGTPAQTQQPGGLFNKPATTFGAPNTGFGAPATGFGAPAAGAGAAGGLFGGSAFGAKPAATQAPTFSGFNTSTTANTGLGGGLNLTGGGLFGAKPAGTGLFGAPAPQQQAGGLFGGGGGMQNTLGGGLNTGGNTFGTGNTGLGGFGSGLGGLGGLNTGLNSGLNTGLNTGLGFGANNAQMNNFNMGLLGGNTGASVHEQMIALASKPFGHSPLLKDLVPSPGKADDMLKPTNPVAQKALLESDKFKVSPGVARLKVKPINTNTPLSKSLFDGLEENDPSLQEMLTLKPSVKRLSLRTRPLTSQPPTTEQSAEPPTQREQSPNTSRTLPVIEASPDRVEPRRGSFSESVVLTHRNDTHVLKEKISPTNIQRRVGLTDPRGSSLKLNTSLNATTTSNNDSDLDRRSSWLNTNPAAQWPSGADPSAPLDNTVEHLLPKTNRLYPSLAQEQGLIEDTDSQESQEREEPPTPHPTGIKLYRPGYYTIPHMDELLGYLRPDGTCIVPQFTIGRRGYGNVFFDGEMDVAGLDLDEIVHIMNKEIVVYPDDENKPPQGRGLNRKAQVTLDQVWPLDKTSRQPITDPERLAKMDFEGKLRRVSDKYSTKFIEYRPQTGSWVFKVQHFSKYGLTESDEEDSNEPTKPEGKATASQKMPPPASLPRGLGGLAPPSAGSLGLSQGLGGPSTSLYPELPDQDMERDSSVRRFGHLGKGGMSAMDTSEENSVESTTLYPEPSHYMAQYKDGLSPVSVGRGLDPHRSHSLQLMKASLYAGEMQEEEDAASFTDQLVPDAYSDVMDEQVSIKEAPKEVSEMEIRPPIVKPKSVMLRYHKRILPFKRTIAGKLDAACYVDLAIAQARLLRVGWGPASQLATLTTLQKVNQGPLSGDLLSLPLYIGGRDEEDTSGQVAQRLRVAGGGIPTDMGRAFKDSIEGHLEICLQHCEIESAMDTSQSCVEPPAEVRESCPLIKPGRQLAAAAQHLREATRRLTTTDNKFGISSRYCRDVWSLCLALWGAHGDPDSDPSKPDGGRLLAQHAALSAWLQECAQAGTEDQQEGADAAAPLIRLLGARRLREACQRAHSQKDYMLALMLAQIGGDGRVRSLAGNQLNAWRETMTDRHVSAERLAALSLVAGRARLLLGDRSTLHTCRGLSWITALALHFWYICESVATVGDAIAAYEESFWLECDVEEQPPTGKLSSATYSQILNSRVAFPHPQLTSEMENTPNEEEKGHKLMLDMCYQLLSLRACKWNSLDSIINPDSHTPDPLDYRLSWLVQQFLEGCGYSHWSARGLSCVHTGFASQLEAHGLWPWAVFVLQHITQPDVRCRAVKEMVMRHFGSGDVDAHRILLCKLGVPDKWMYQAEALRAKYKHDAMEEARNLTLAEEWADAHVVILDKLVPSLILNDNCAGLRNVLRPLVSAGCAGTIPDWNTGGHLYLEFLDIWDTVKSLVQCDAEQLAYRCEALRPRIAAACSAISNLNPPSFKHTVARCEISARLAQVGCLVVGGAGGDIPGCAAPALLSLIARLDLPADYSRQLLDKVAECLKEPEMLC